MNAQEKEKLREQRRLKSSFMRRLRANLCMVSRAAAKKSLAEGHTVYIYHRRKWGNMYFVDVDSAPANLHAGEKV